MAKIPPVEVDVILALKDHSDWICVECLALVPPDFADPHARWHERMNQQREVILGYDPGKPVTEEQDKRIPALAVYATPTGFVVREGDRWRPGSYPTVFDALRGAGWAVGEADQQAEAEPPDDEFPQHLLDRLGTSATEWAAEFDRVVYDGLDMGTVIGWFANAIEAGRRAALTEQHRWRYP